MCTKGVIIFKQSYGSKWIEPYNYSVDISIKLCDDMKTCTEVENESVIFIDCQSGDGKSSMVNNKVIDGGIYRKSCSMQLDLLISGVWETSVIK